uniref:Integrase catalytic domain-containing protein n=1 Tax=Cacopsylla melanoneura TaxID=428564 RepID=A0A8D8Z6D4_9HEMI
MGNAPVLQSNEVSSKSSHCLFQKSNIDESLLKFWELESIPTIQDLKLSPEEKACEQIYSTEQFRDEKGTYVVPLPFKDDPSLLGDSFVSSRKRFLSLERRLESSEILRKNYNKAMSDLLEKGFIRKCSNQSDTSGFFIPHLCVERPEHVSTPIRIVFDASAKTSSGKSLNDLLHAGPKLYSNLFSVLLRYRLFPYALNGDITKMFLMIKVCEKYLEYQKLIWRFSKNDPLEFYEIVVVVFGIKPSPYLALRTVQQLVKDEAENFPYASKFILDSLYMDDCVTSFPSQDKAVKFYQQVSEMFRSGGFSFTKWSSNSSKVLEAIPPSDQLAEIVSWDKDNLTLKVLGMHWNANSDQFLFRVNQEPGTCTKRGMLSYILSIYDPLGLLAPVVLFVKLLIKELWTLHLDWDAIPPSNIIETWKTFLGQLSLLESLHFPRHINVCEGCTFQLVGFSDASLQAYGATIYSRVLLPNGEIKVELVCAKSKVAPIKVESIPRLELCGLLLLSELMKTVVESYSNRFEISKMYYFTDSTVALCWAHSSPHLYHVFVANRISKIQQNIDISQLYHVNGPDNPADGLSRGLLPEKLVSDSLYISGPPWLCQEEETWPTRSHSDFTLKEVPETKSVTLLGVENYENRVYDMFARCSSWPKLLNVIVFILRFLKLLPINSFITANDLELAETSVVKVLQTKFFLSDIDKIKANLSCSPSLSKLSPFLDDNGVLRVGGRISNNTNLSYSHQHPILLPAKQHLVTLIVDYLHVKNFHTGPHLLLALLRQKYWVLGARSLVRKRFQECNFCFKHSPKFVYPKMADLPSSRVVESKPFLNTACDYLGPISFTLSRLRGQRSQKAWICLFICLATKAIHLEVAFDLSTPSFLNAFKRFLSRRGPIKTILSDNGTNFVGAKNHLNEVFTILESPEYKERFNKEIAELRIVWKFNPPSSPHFGGIFEANVKSFKTHFVKVVGNQILSLDELGTLTVQIEGLLNSRPLCKLTSDPDDTDMLTPNHFLKLTPLTCIPAVDVTDVPLNRLSRFQLIDQMMQSFWKRWSFEYLSSLQVREKWLTSCENIKPGTLVLIRQDNAAPLNWPVGVITEVYPGKDGIVRVASVRTPRGECRRAVSNLCSLPTQ